MNQTAKIDDNRRRSLLGVTDDSAAELRRLLIDPTTGRLKVSAIIASGSLTSINGDTTIAQIIALGSTGTDANIVDNGTGTHTIHLPSASATNRGLLTAADWSTFNGKQDALTFGIANTNKVQINSADVEDNDYAKFTATGLEGRSYTEVLSDIGAAPALGDDDNYVTDAEKTKLSNLSGTNTGDETAARIATIITGAGAQTTPLDADEFPFYKIVGTVLSKVTWANIKATLATYFGITIASSAAPSSMDFFEDTDNGTNKITVTAPSAVASDKVLTLPDATGTIALLETVYPVGSVYTNKTDSTNPATLFGFGTWAAIAGRVVVGIDGTQTEFDTAGETGGAKTHTLTGSESGTSAHGHTASSGNDSPDHSHNYTNLTGIKDTGDDDNRYGAASGGGSVAFGTTGATARHTHTITVNNSSAANASSAHNNLQPYVVCYVWERTA